MKDSSFQPMTMDEIVADALEKGCTVRAAKDNELMLDIDSDADYERYQWFFNIKLQSSQSTYTVTEIEEWKSKSGNRHVVITLQNELPTSERIALQAMAGSDMGREFAALQCLKAGSQHPVLLFVPAVAR